jgi:MFS family permease
MGHFAIPVLVSSFGAGVVLAIVVTGRAHGSHDPRDTVAWRRYGRDQGLAMVGVCIGLVVFTFSTHLAWWRWVLIAAAVLGFVIASVSFIGNLRQSLVHNKTARAVEAQLLTENEKREREEREEREKREERDAAEAARLAEEQRVEQERRASAHSAAVWAAMRAELDDVVAAWPTAPDDHLDPENAK